MDLTINGEVLAQLFLTNKQDQTEFLAALKDADGDNFKAGDALKEALIPYSQKLRQHFKKEGIDETTRRLNTKWEKQFDEEGFTPQSQGVEIIGEWKNYVKSKIKPTEKVVTKEVELTEETAVQNPVVQRLIATRTQIVSKEKDTKIEELTTKLQAQHNARVEDALRKGIIEVAKSAKINLGDNATTVNARTRSLMREAKSKAHDFKINQETGEITPLGKDGSPLKDSQLFNEMSFYDFIVKEVNEDGNLFPISQVDPSKNSPAPPQNNTPPRANQHGKRFADQDDFQKQFNDPSLDKEAKRELFTAWKDQQAKETA